MMPTLEITVALREEVLQRINLASLIRSQGHQLESRAGGMVGVGSCPFCRAETGERGSPAFAVFERLPTSSPGFVSVYHCRRCPARGNAIGFWMRRHTVTYRDALLALCDEADIPFREEVIWGEVGTVCELAVAMMEDVRYPKDHPGRNPPPGWAWEKARLVAMTQRNYARAAQAGEWAELKRAA